MQSLWSGTTDSTSSGLLGGLVTRHKTQQDFSDCRRQCVIDNVHWIQLDDVDERIREHERICEKYARIVDTVVRYRVRMKGHEQEIYVATRWRRRR